MKRRTKKIVLYALALYILNMVLVVLLANASAEALDLLRTIYTVVGIVGIGLGLIFIIQMLKRLHIK